MHVAASDWCHDHVEFAFIGYVCIAYMNPLVGITLEIKSFLLCFVEIFVMCTIFRTGYIYIYIYFYFVVTLSFICGLIPPQMDQ